MRPGWPRSFVSRRRSAPSRRPTSTTATARPPGIPAHETAPRNARCPSSVDERMRTGQSETRCRSVGELLPVRRLPPRARDQHLDGCRSGAARVADESPDDGRGERELLVRDRAVALDVGAEMEHVPFREDRAAALRHEHADGVRADVDDPDGTSIWWRPHRTAVLMRSSKSPRPLTSAHECGLRPPPPLGLLGDDAMPGAVGLELPRLRVVGEQRLQDRLDLVPHVRVLDRHDHLDAVVEVARHQVGAAEEVRPLVARLEAVEPAVLEEAAEDRAHADLLAAAPGRPGSSVQLARTMRSISAPACEAL